jgi:hypothetical protein
VTHVSLGANTLDAHRITPARPAHHRLLLLTAPYNLITRPRDICDTIAILHTRHVAPHLIEVASRPHPSHTPYLNLHEEQSATSAQPPKTMFFFFTCGTHGTLKSSPFPRHTPSLIPHQSSTPPSKAPNTSPCNVKTAATFPAAYVFPLPQHLLSTTYLLTPITR